MNTIRMPGFTADASLYKTHRRYRKNNIGPLGEEANITPQTRVQATGARPGNPELNRLCSQMADVINDSLDQADHEANRGNTGEANAWTNNAVDMLKAGMARGTCSFSAA